MRQTNRTALAFLLPSGIGVLILFLGPVCYSMIYTFSRTSGRFTFTGLSNYASLFASEAFRLALVTTYGLMLLFIVSLMAVSLSVVYFLETSGRTLQYLALLSVALILPSALVVNFVKPFTGMVDNMPRLTLLLLYLWKHVGIHSLILKAMSMKMNPAWRESAQLDGAGRLQSFWYIELPYLWPYMKFLLVFDGLCFFRMFRESYLLYGLYPPEEVYVIQNFFVNNFQNLNYQRLSTGAVITMVPLLLAVFGIFKVGDRVEEFF